MVEANFNLICSGVFKLLLNFTLSELNLWEYTECQSSLSEDVSTSNVDYMK